MNVRHLIEKDGYLKNAALEVATWPKQGRVYIKHIETGEEFEFTRGDKDREKCVKHCLKELEKKVKAKKAKKGE